MARILAFTGAGGDNFYYTTGLDGAPQMQVSDNSASSFVVDFSDTALLAGISADSLFQPGGTGRMRGRDRLRGAPVLVGRAEQAE